MEASHSDPATAYAAVNRFRLDDLRPHIYRTRDGGATWQEIVRGIPVNEVVNAVREDPERRGLLFAATERGVYVSFDDGDEWRSLRNNLPATSVRDLVVHGDDLVVGTHGRSFWILDDITPLRQMEAQTSAADAHLFRPQIATRVKRSQWPDTPLPPEEPAGQNPPDGAIVNFLLKARPAQPVVLEIVDAAGKLVRRFSSADRPESVDPELNVPTYWVRPAAGLSAEPGLHRFVWDLHFPPPDVLEHEYPISAVPHDTPRHPLGPAVLPGTYTVRLIAGGRTATAPLTVRMDPRVKTPPEGLAERFRLATEISRALSRDFAALTEVKAVRVRLKASAAGRRKESPSYDDDLASLEGTGGGRREAHADDLAGLNGKLASLYAVVEGSDTPPTTQAVAAWKELSDSLDKTLARWAELKKSGGGGK